MILKFLTDAMLGKLTRFLRIFGYDTVYANDLEDYFGLRPLPDDKLLEYATKNDRILITRDYPFYKKIPKNRIFLEGEGVYNYLKQLKDKLNLNYNFSMEKARCSICNAILSKVTNKESIRNEVQPETFKFHDDFFQCENLSCKKIFWEGTHINDIIKKMNINHL